MFGRPKMWCYYKKYAMVKVSLAIPFPIAPFR